MINLIYTALVLLSWIESRDGLNKKPGDNGRAIGRYQLWKGVVTDVNKIYNRHYSYDDRKNDSKARTISFLYLKHYVGAYEKKTGKKATLWIICKIFHNGPNGWKRTNDNKYRIAFIKARRIKRL